jgi:hypothetical protein
MKLLLTRKKDFLNIGNYSPCRWERPLFPDIQRKSALPSRMQLTFPGETLVLVKHCPTILGGAFAACGSPYSSILRLLGHFFVESQTKLNVLRLHVQLGGE